MNVKSLVLSGTLALASLSIASAKSYDIILSSPTQVSNLQLKAGEYRFQLKGNNAIFTNVESGKKYTAPASLKTVDKKYDVTAVDTNRKSDADQMQAIELGGTSTKVEFNATE